MILYPGLDKVFELKRPSAPAATPKSRSASPRASRRSTTNKGPGYGEKHRSAARDRGVHARRTGQRDRLTEQYRTGSGAGQLCSLLAANTSAPISMPVFDALRVSWNAASPRARLWRPRFAYWWTATGRLGWALANGAPTCTVKARPIRSAGRCSWPAHLQLDSKVCHPGPAAHLPVFKDEKATPAVTLLGVSTHVVDVIPPGAARSTPGCA